MRKFLLMLLSLGAITGAGFALSSTASAQTIDNTRDCDTVAIIKCGTMSVSEMRTKAAQGDVPKVFAAFNIKQSDLQGDFVEGVVWKDGRITLGKDGKGALVATGAATAGRWSTPKAGMEKIAGTNDAYKMWTSHFVTDGQAAFIKMIDGRFGFAVIKSCGNPVAAKPIVPAVVCESLEVKTLGRDEFSFKANVPAPKNATFKKVTYVVKKNGQTVTSFESTERNATVTKKFANLSTGEYSVEAFVTYEAFGKTYVTPVGNCKGKFVIKAQPEFVCVKLTAAQQGDRTRFLFTPQVKLVDASFKKVTYTVKDDKGAVILTDTETTLNPYTYTNNKTGKYSVSAVVTVTVDGQEKIATGTCVANFEVKPEPVTPLYECTDLKGVPVAGQKNTIAFTLTYVAEGGAKLNKVAVDYGDGKGSQNVALSQLPTFNYTYAKAGAYTATASLTFTVNSNEASTKTITCTESVSITEYCTVAGKEHLPVDSPECKAPVVTTTTPTPTTLVNTGPGEVIGMVAATAVAGAIAHRLVWTRRFGREG